MKQRLPTETDSNPVFDYPDTVTAGWTGGHISEDAKWKGWPTERPFLEIYYNNSDTVDWDHFAKLKYVSARDGVLYMYGLNPAVHKPGAAVGAHITRPSVLVDEDAIAFFAEVQAVIDLVESERRDDWTAGALLQWADGHPDIRYQVHSMFRSIACVAPLISPAAATPGDVTQNAEPPGTLPRRAMGEVAVKVAFELEVALKRRATATEIMARLRELANKGERPDILKAPGKDGRSVEWVTRKGELRIYSLEALNRTLQVWHKSRH